MRVLLPPSEAKSPGGRGRPIDARPDDGSELAAARRQARAALARLLEGDPQAAAQALLLPAGVADDALARNAAVGRSRTSPALRRYAGVVYDGLDLASADAEVRRCAERNVVIFSGLFGVVRGDEPIPDYRVPAKAVLPGIGVAGTFWRRRLDALLGGPQARRILGQGLIVDLRSGDYAAMWRPGPAHRDRVIAVRMLSPLPRGGYGVISFNSKFAKGQLARALLQATADGAEPRSADDVVSAWLRCGGRDAAPGVTTGARTGLDLLTA